jgi:hypothetical protein
VAFVETDRPRHKGLSARDYLVTLTQIRHGLAMELKMHIGEQIQIPGCCDTFADLETLRHLSAEHLFHGARKGSG